MTFYESKSLARTVIDMADELCGANRFGQPGISEGMYGDRGTWEEHKDAAKVITKLIKKLQSHAADLMGRQAWGDFPITQAAEEMKETAKELEELYKKAQSKRK